MDRLEKAGRSSVEGTCAIQGRPSRAVSARPVRRDPEFAARRRAGTARLGMGSLSRNRGTRFKSASHFGVTAVELVVVVFILAIIAAAAVPRYVDSLMRARVDAAARRIVADLAAAQARAKATSSNQTVTFVVPPQGSQYRIVGMSDPDRPGAAYSVDLTASPYQATLSSVDLGNDTTLVFNGYGVPDSSGTIVVQAGNYTKTVTIDSSTGMARVQ